MSFYPGFGLKQCPMYPLYFKFIFFARYITGFTTMSREGNLMTSADKRTGKGKIQAMME
jgi:hypothetical protein